MHDHSGSVRCPAHACARSVQPQRSPSTAPA